MNKVERPLRGKELEMAIEVVIDEASKWGLEVVKHKNNTIHKNNDQQVNHLTITGGVRNVEYYPSKGTFYSNGVKGTYRLVKGTGLRDAMEVAKNGSIKKH